MKSMTADQIRNLRQSLGETQTEFSKRLGLTRDAVAHWEIGRGHPGGSAVVLMQQLLRRKAKTG